MPPSVEIIYIKYIKYKIYLKDFWPSGANRIIVAAIAVIFNVTLQMLFLLADTLVLSTTI